MPDYTLSAKITGDSSGFDKAIQNAEKSASSFEKQMESISKKAKGIGDKISGIGTKLTVGVTTPITLAGERAVTTAAEFESAMSRTQGALNATSEEMESLTDLAIEMGAQTIFSASDAGDAMNELAKGGLTIADIQAGALKSTMDLAASSGMDMATSANTIVKAMGGFQLSAEQTNEAVNALAGAAAASASDVSDISMALSQAAASANNAGWSIQDTTAVLGAFADAGIVGSDAGTSLKTMLQRLSAPTDEAAALMEQLGINVYDSDGHMLDAAGVAQELQAALAGLGDQQRAQALDTIFGADATRAATVLMNEGAEGIAKYTQATNDQTAAERLANAQLGPLQKSIENMKGSIETASIAVGDILTPKVQAAADWISQLANRFTNMSPQAQKAVLAIVGIAAAAGPVLIVLGKLVSSFGIVTGAVGSMTKAISGIKNIGGIFSAITSPVGLAVAAITALVAAFAYLMTTNEEFRTSVMNTLSVIGESLMPILQTIGQLLTSIGSILVNVLAGALTQLAPILTQMVTFIGSLVQIVAPLVNMLIQSLVPVITQIITSVSNIVNSIIPPLIDILSAVMDAIESILPPIQSVLEAAIEAISSIINAIGPIVGIVGECVSGIMVIVSPIVSFIGDIISGIMSVVNPIVNFFSEIFGSIFSTVSDIFNNIYSVVSGVFTGIQNSWSGLTSFVGGVVDGISGAFNTLVSTVKSVINGVIKGINGAIGVINLIPGVNIGKISYLLHGTDDWQGGFAYMNEGGRGELTYLPNGAQVIPHDISVQYAKEAARANRGVESIDLTGVLEGVTIQVYSQTNVDGTPLKEMAADYTIQKIGREQRAFNRSRGISYA